MSVQLLFFDGCPHHRLAEDRLALALAETRPGERVERIRIVTIAQTETRGFHGSPTILIDGVDPFAVEDAPVTMACHRYETPAGPDGMPTAWSSCARYPD